MSVTSMFPSEFTESKIKQYRKILNSIINKHTIDRFKVVAEKDMRKM
jgi:hypothetical protein